MLLVSSNSMVCADQEERTQEGGFSLQSESSREDTDQSKTAEQLLQEAQFLLADERLLDARTKLLNALKKDPREYRAHVLLSGYYLIHVGHFRLALKHIKQAQALFHEQHGLPPYIDAELQSQHGRILYFLSETRLNLDNYSGALTVLNEYSSYQYFGPWYPASRAWVLMKVGRLDEAIQVARLGLLAGAQPGRIYNMLGILLSMTGDKDMSLEVFNDAILHEMSLGEMGQPGTPLNNSGEVLRELFRDDKAEASFLKSTRMRDGCEHVLPSMNLVNLYVDQARYENAKRAMDNFEACVKQFPLRNGEEHRAMVHLARGRVRMHTGRLDLALPHLEGALERQQWFGKIGTSQEDLRVAAMMSIAQALRRYNNHLRFKRDYTWKEWLRAKRNIGFNAIRARWLMHRARQTLIENLNGLEDLNIRHTDSMLEYSTLGELLSGYSLSTLHKRIDQELEDDQRGAAKPYYYGYLAEAYLNSWNKARGRELLDRALLALRPKYDLGLKLHLGALKLAQLEEGSVAYKELASQIYSKAPAMLRNYGLSLPVNYSGLSSVVRSEISQSAFLLDNTSPLAYSIEQSQEGNEVILTFSAQKGLIRNVRVSGQHLPKAIDTLTDKVFSVQLK